MNTVCTRYQVCFTKILTRGYYVGVSGIIPVYHTAATLLPTRHHHPELRSWSYFSVQ